LNYYSSIFELDGNFFDGLSFFGEEVMTKDGEQHKDWRVSEYNPRIDHRILALIPDE